MIALSVSMCVDANEQSMKSRSPSVQNHSSISIIIYARQNNVTHLFHGPHLQTVHDGMVSALLGTSCLRTFVTATISLLRVT